jgi:hypothetical protein
MAAVPFVECSACRVPWLAYEVSVAGGRVALWTSNQGVAAAQSRTTGRSGGGEQVSGGGEEEGGGYIRVALKHGLDRDGSESTGPRSLSLFSPSLQDSDPPRLAHLPSKETS